ncbi:Fanconi anemia core complex-associated protein 24-like [Tubulanus polymorphus]|uniref:Fanconi anemia core complex-associated protein 24-like n=1 Tax=Tubulanus polymorphus TaxID=672921 RepID=UPI003DA62C55
MNGSSMSTPSGQKPKTPKKPGSNIPNGHLILHPKWKGSKLQQVLQNSVNVLFQDHQTIVDIFPTSNIGVIYLTESDLATGTMYKQKLWKLRKSDTMRGIVIAEKTTFSSQYYQPLQKLVVFELGLTLLPVTCQSEAAGLLINMCLLDGKSNGNQFLQRRKQPPVDEALLNSVLLIPGIGDVKARMLLQKFHSLKGICDASVQDLSAILGNAPAQNIKSFFTKPTPVSRPT